MAVEGLALHPRLTTSGTHLAPPALTPCTAGQAAHALLHRRIWQLHGHCSHTGAGAEKGLSGWRCMLLGRGAWLLATLTWSPLSLVQQPAWRARDPAHTLSIRSRMLPCAHPLMQADTPRDLDYNSELVTVGEGPGQMVAHCS